MDEKAEKKKIKTKKVAHIFSIICMIIALSLLVTALALLLAAVMLWIGMITEENVTGNILISLCGLVFPLFSLISFNNMSNTDIVTLLLGSSGIILWFSVYLFHRLSKLFQMMEYGKQFFKKSEIKKARKIALCCIAVSFCQPFFLVTALLMFFLSFVFDYGLEIEEEANHTIELQEDVILSLAAITDGKSGETGQHVKRVSEYSRLIAENMNYTKRQIENIRIAASIHDIGKLMIPLEILEKPGKLTSEEFEIMKKHVIYGEQMLHNANGEIMKLAAKIALEHHERWDGKGYLEKKKEEISREARIVAFADVFDALSSKRCYKEAWKSDDVYQEMVAQSGRQFDPQIVEVFVRIYPKFLEIGNENNL